MWCSDTLVVAIGFAAEVCSICPRKTLSLFSCGACLSSLHRNMIKGYNFCVFAYGQTGIRGLHWKQCSCIKHAAVFNAALIKELREDLSPCFIHISSQSVWLGPVCCHKYDEFSPTKRILARRVQRRLTTRTDSLLRAFPGAGKTHTLSNSPTKEKQMGLIPYVLEALVASDLLNIEYVSL